MVSDRLAEYKAQTMETLLSQEKCKEEPVTFRLPSGSSKINGQFIFISDISDIEEVEWMTTHIMTYVTDRVVEQNAYLDA